MLLKIKEIIIYNSINGLKKIFNIPKEINLFFMYVKSLLIKLDGLIP